MMKILTRYGVLFFEVSIQNGLLFNSIFKIQNSKFSNVRCAYFFGCKLAPLEIILKDDLKILD